jgi:hypothetical protein
MMTEKMLEKLSENELGELYQLSKTACLIDPMEEVCLKAFCLGGCNDSIMQECLAHIESLRGDDEE